MKSLLGSHLLSLKDFNRDQLDYLFSVADKLTPYVQRQRKTHVLDGAVLASLFFEPSTRTRISFGSAFSLLGGRVLETTGMATSSLSKGESLYDTAQVISGYSDAIVMRHPQAFSVAEFAEGSRVPVINGGDGPNEHPTQALLDTYTPISEMNKQGKSLVGLHITLMGDLLNGRTVHSLSQLLSLYSKLNITLLAPDALQLPDKYRDLLENAGHRIEQTEALEQGLAHADVIYQTRVQEERFETQQEADRYRGQYRLNLDIYQRINQGKAVIMHPLPRDSRPQANELDNDLNAQDRLAIFRQSDNGVKVRMALFACILGVEQQIEANSQAVNWHYGVKPA